MHHALEQALAAFEKLPDSLSPDALERVDQIYDRLEDESNGGNRLCIEERLGQAQDVERRRAATTPPCCKPPA
jgi:hypothetical protein